MGIGFYPSLTRIHWRASFFVTIKSASARTTMDPSTRLPLSYGSWLTFRATTICRFLKPSDVV